jgi:hypothetical protein
MDSERSDRDGLGNGRPGTMTDGKVTAEHAGVRTVAGPHRCDTVFKFFN